MSDWESLGSVDPARLIDARLQLHWAAQAASAPGRQVLDHRPDFSEQSFRWLDGSGALAQGMAQPPGRHPFRTALRPSPPAILLLDGDDGEGGALGELPLAGRTLDEAYAWLTAEVEALRPAPRPASGAARERLAGPSSERRPAVRHVGCRGLRRGREVVRRRASAPFGACRPRAGRLGGVFPQFPYIAHSRGWTAEDMERNVEYVQRSQTLHDGARALVGRAVDMARALLAVEVEHGRVTRAGRKGSRAMMPEPAMAMDAGRMGEG